MKILHSSKIIIRQVITLQIPLKKKLKKVVAQWLITWRISGKFIIDSGHFTFLNTLIPFIFA
jgi:hypothetical protein